MFFLFLLKYKDRELFYQTSEDALSWNGESRSRSKVLFGFGSGNMKLPALLLQGNCKRCLFGLLLECSVDKKNK